MSKSTSTIQIRLLGTPQIEHDTVPIQKLGSQKSLLLLAYLIRHPQEHSRSKLSALFWADQSPAKARGNLRWALNNLSKLVPDCFAATRQTLRYQPPPATTQTSPWIDVNAFLILTSTLLPEPHQGDSGPSRAGLSASTAHSSKAGTTATVNTAEGSDDFWTQAVAAVDLYRGEFLEGMTVDDAPDLELWLLQERELLRRRLLTLLEMLVGHWRDIGHFARAITYSERLLALEGWHEAAHRQLMWLLATTGQQGAALAQYESCRKILAAELGVEPDEETTALYEEIRTGQLFPNITDITDSVGSVDSRPDAAAPTQAPTTPQRPKHELNEAPVVQEFYGRQTESAHLQRWLSTPETRLILIVGMGGMGKTTFTAHMTQQVVDHFPVIVWRTLANLPTAEQIIHDWVQTLSGQQALPWPEQLDEQLRLLLHYLQRQRCFLILDNYESVLQEQGEAGHHRPGYEQYEQLLTAIAHGNHQSTLLVTSREEPYALARLMDTGKRIQRLELSGLDLDAGRSLLTERGVTDSYAMESTLVMRASGSPLALKIIADTIYDLFHGDIGAFLDDETFLFDDVRHILEQQYNRLSPLEQALLLWLAIEREDIDLSDLQANLAPPVPRHTFLEAIRSLERRSLLEKSNHGISLQQMVAEHAITHFIATICDEITTLTPQLFKSHALCKSLTKEYLRASQLRLIVHPILDRLVAQFGPLGLEEQLRRLATHLQTETDPANGEQGLSTQGPSTRGHYGGGNLINLLVALESDLTGWDFSRLPIWQAHLPQVALPGVDFTEADFAKTSFADSFGLVHAVAFHPGGQELAATAEHEIRLWRDPDGQRSGVLRGHTDDVWAIAFNEEGTLLVSGSWDQTVRLWDLGSQKSIRTLLGHTKGVTSVAFSPDSQLIAGGGYDHTIRLWETESGRAVQTLYGHKLWVWGVAFSPDGGLLATASADQTVRLWQVRTGETLAVLTGHTDQVWSVAFSPDGRYLASGGNDGLVLLWDMRSRTIAHTLHGHTNWVRSLAFSTDGTLLASGSNDSTVRLWLPATGQPLQTLHGHRNAVNTVAISQSSRYLASGSNDQSVRIWELATGQTARIFHGHTNWVRAIIFDQSGELLVSGGDDGVARLWRSEPSATAGSSWREVHRFTGHTQMVRSVALHQTGRYLATASADQTVRIWETATGETKHILRGHSNWVSSVAWRIAATEDNPAEEHLVLSSSWDGTICLWHGITGTQLRTFRGHSQAIYSAIFQPRGNLIASGSGDRTLRLWDWRSGATVAILHGHTDDVRALAFSADGRLLVSGSEDGTLRLWELPASKQVIQRASARNESDNNIHSAIHVRRVINAHPKGIRAVALRADGALVAAGSDDGTISLWSWADGKRLQHLTEHSGIIWQIAFTPDGSHLASGSTDGTIRLWRVADGRCVATLTIPGPYVAMNISGARGLTSAQRETLKSLGAIEQTLDAAAVAPQQPKATETSIATPAPATKASQPSPVTALPNNLPRNRTPLIGRDAELAQICELLLEGSRPLVTLLGEGGLGKTRLAMAVGLAVMEAVATSEHPKQFADGIWYIPLAGVDLGDSQPPAPRADSALTDAAEDSTAMAIAPIPDAQQLEVALVTAIGTALHLSFVGTTPPTSQLIDYLRGKQLLLILDNFEQLLDSALFLSDLLAEAPQVQLLATSRVPLRLQEEWRVPLQGLRVPAQNDKSIHPQSAVFAAIDLFVQSAQRLTPDFQLDETNADAVTAICRYVNGLPLAIELATTVLTQLSCQELAAALIPTAPGTTDAGGQGLDLLQTPLRNVPPRHRHIRNVFAYSWQLLGPNEQRCAMQVALFRSGGDRTALVTVTQQSAATLTTLVNHSLLYRDADGRYTMHELLRQFALEQLTTATDPTLAVTTKERHSSYYLQRLQVAEVDLKGYAPQPTLAALRPELDNIRQAWQWAVQHAAWSLLQASCAALTRLYLLIGLPRTGHSAMEELIQALTTQDEIAEQQANGSASERITGELLLEALITAAHFCNNQAAFERAIVQAEEAVQLSQQLALPHFEAAATLRWGEALWYQGEVERAQPKLKRALALLTTAWRETDTPATTTQELRVDALWGLGLIAVRMGNYDEAIVYYEESHSQSEALTDAYRVGRALYSLGTVYRNQGQYASAQRYLEQGLAITERTGDRQSESRGRNTLGDIYLYRGDYTAARTQYSQVAQLAQEVGDRRSESIAQTNLGIVARDLGHYEVATEHFELSLGLARTIGFQRGEGWTLCCQSLLSHQTNRPQDALRQAKQALTIFEQLGDRLGLAFSQTNLGRAHGDLGEWADAQAAYETALALREELAQPHLVAEVRAGLAQVLWEEGERAAAEKQLEEIVPYLLDNDPDGLEAPFAVYERMYWLLHQTAAPHAAQVAAAAVDFFHRRHSLLSEKMDQAALQKIWMAMKIQQ